MDDKCVFCNIAAGKIPSKLIYEDGDVVAFNDISPQAPVHVLVIPRQHIAGLNTLGPGEREILQRMMDVVRLLAGRLKIAESGYRTVINCNQEGGQTVFHLHIHLLGGRQLGGSMVG